MVEDLVAVDAMPAHGRRTQPIVPVVRHTAGQSILLHLAPAVPAMAVYITAVPFAHRLGLPTIAALALSGLLAVAPVQLGLLAVHRRRHPSERSNQLQVKLPRARLLALIGAEIALAAAAFALTAHVGEVLRASWFGWWPSGWAVDGGAHAGFSPEALLVTSALLLLGSVVVAPLVEEFYFRGFLLPRMPARLGRCTPLVHALLFVSYHLWTPWLAPTRFLAILPLAYLAHRTRDIRIGVVAHMVLNAVDLAVLITFVLTAQRPS
jgi:uncharacterized protein